MKRATNQSLAAARGLNTTMNKLFLIFVLCLALPALASAQSDPLSPSFLPPMNTNPADYPSNIWVTDTMQKVLRGSGSPGTVHWGTFYGTQGEFVDFQVHVQAPAGGYAALTVSSSGFAQTSPNSFTIPAPSTSNSDVVVYSEAYLNITNKSATAPVYYNVTGYYPDPLIPAIDPYYHQVTNAFPVAVAANQNQSAWIDVFIPQNAPSGYYSGTITVSNGGSTLATLPIVIGVWQWPSSQGGHMPATSTLPSTIQYGWADFCNAAYGGTGSCSVNNTDTDGAVMFMDHRWTLTDPVNANANQMALIWGGTTAGITGAKPIIPGATTTGVNWRSQTGIWSEQGFASAFGANKYPSGSTGTYPLVTPFYQTADEPGSSAGNWTALCNAGATAHATTPPIATEATAGITDMNNNNASNCLDILTPNVITLDPIGGSLTRSNYNSWLAHSNPDGIKPMLWSYLSCSSAGTCGGATGGSAFNYPNYNIDSKPAGNRVMEWLTYFHQQTGELYYYATCIWESSCGPSATDPWTTLYAFGNNGDGTLAYPSTWHATSTHHVTLQSGSPLTTEIWIPRMVLKHMRDGMQDWEYMHVLTKEGQGAYVTTQIQSWITNSYTYEYSGTGLQAARKNLGTTIHQLTYSSSLLPPPTLSGTLQ